MSVATSYAPATHTFAIGDAEFLLDGKPFVIRCGEIHFPRVPRAYWQQRLQMCRALGLNTVCVYLFWNFHEWDEGVFDWSGQADVVEFCRLAHAEGLWVILRPGPYSCAEWEMGGLPWWLVKHDGIELRSRDPRYLGPATRYLREVARVLGPQQITRGGPLLMVQVENEYGSYGEDREYMGALRQTLIDGGFDVPLFACNPANALRNGWRADLFQVVNFGAGAAKEAFAALRQVQPQGPLMNGEYYPAWFDVWGRQHRTGDPAPIAADLEYMLRHRHSFSIYMAHGGTSFGLWSGADRPFLPDTSSYDYDAPISEAGWVTPKFQAIRDVFSRHLQPGETLSPPPPPNPVIAIERFQLGETARLFDNLPTPHIDREARPMEHYGQSRGVIVYRTRLPASAAGRLTIQAVHDFAWVFVEGHQVGILDRRIRRTSVPIVARAQEATLELVVEAVGRVNFGREVFDRKGLHGPVRWVVDGASVELRDWQVYSFQSSSALTPVGPAFWRGEFSVGDSGDTFLDLRAWGKGVAWVNAHCLGRFWNIGPTQTMYLPGCWVQRGRNEILILDLVGPTEPVIAGLREPILDILRLELDFSRSARATGEFSADAAVRSQHAELKDAPGWQTIEWGEPVDARYFAFEILATHRNRPLAAISELELLDSAGRSLSKASWHIVWVSGEETTSLPGYVENILDGQPNTFWLTAPVCAPHPFPHRVVIDLGRNERIAACRSLPRNGESDVGGRVSECRVYFSAEPFGLTIP